LKVIQNGTGDILQLFDGANQVVTVKDGGNLLVGKTALDNSTVGIRMNATGDASFVSDGARPLVLNRKTSDGDIALFLKDGAPVGSIGVTGANAYINSHIDGSVKNIYGWILRDTNDFEFCRD
jgi:hypothetical protein